MRYSISIQVLNSNHEEQSWKRQTMLYTPKETSWHLSELFPWPIINSSSPFFAFWKQVTQVEEIQQPQLIGFKFTVSAWHTITAGTACTNQTMLTKPRHTGYAGKMSTQQHNIGLPEYLTTCPMVICNTSLTWSWSWPSLGGVWSIKIQVKT